MERTTSPHFADPYEPVEQTLALIRPEAMCYRDAIVQRLLAAGFKILCTAVVKLTVEQASELYAADDNEAGNYALRMASLCVGPVQAMCLAKRQAIAELQALIGCVGGRWPGSLRAQFAGGAGEQCAAIYGSRDAAHARTEIRFFFPAVVAVDATVPMDRPAQWLYLSTHVYPLLMAGVYEMCKRRTASPGADAVVQLADWLWENNPRQALDSGGHVGFGQMRREIVEMQRRLSGDGCGVVSTINEVKEEAEEEEEVADCEVPGVMEWGE